MIQKPTALSFKTPKGEAEFLASYESNLKLFNVPCESFYVFTDYGMTHIIASGPKDAPPLIFLHGFGFGATMWYPNIEALSHTHRTYAVDIIGEFNKSVMIKPFKVKKNCADWLSNVLDKLNIDKATFIGHSNGGWHVLNFAINAPERINRLVLLAPAASIVSMKIKFFVKQGTIMLFRSRSVIINFCKWFVAKENLSKVNEGTFEQFYLGLKHFKWMGVLIPSVFNVELLKQIKAPILLLIGDKEVIYNPIKVIKRAKQLFPNLQSELIPNAGHALSIEQAEVVNKCILKFICVP